MRGLLGEGAPLSKSSIRRLRAGWTAEFEEWSQRRLEGREVVYVWADGIYVRRVLAVARLRFDPEPDVCPTSAISPDELVWPRTVRRAFSDVTATHESTGIHGRGTEEVKTNDVTLRVDVGTVGLTVELGRPGVGIRFRDVEKVTRTLAAHPVRFEERNPVTVLMANRARGVLNAGILDEKVMSCIVEVAMDEADAPGVLDALLDVSREIDTVMALGVAVRCAADGSTEIERMLAEGRYRAVWAKTHVGLGRPDPAQVEAALGPAHA